MVENVPPENPAFAIDDQGAPSGDSLEKNQIKLNDMD